MYFTEGGFQSGPAVFPTTAAVSAAETAELKESYGEVNGADIRQLHVWFKNIYHGYYSIRFVRDQINALFSYRFTACCATDGSVGVDVIQTAAIRADEIWSGWPATMDIYEPEDHGRKIKVVKCMMVASLRRKKTSWSWNAILPGRHW